LLEQQQLKLNSRQNEEMLRCQGSRNDSAMSGLALNGGVLRRSKWSDIESAADNPPASSVPPPLTRSGPRCDFQVALQSAVRLFDHLVGALLEMQRHVETERLGGLEVDHQLELDRGLDGKLVRFRALEDTIGIGRRAPITVG
jgi:hypothetical protein